MLNDLVRGIAWNLYSRKTYVSPFNRCVELWFIWCIWAGRRIRLKLYRWSPNIRHCSNFELYQNAHTPNKINHFGGNSQYQVFCSLWNIVILCPLKVTITRINFGKIYPTIITFFPVKIVSSLSIIYFISYFLCWKLVKIINMKINVACRIHFKMILY